MSKKTYSKTLTRILLYCSFNKCKVPYHQDSMRKWQKWKRYLKTPKGLREAYSKNNPNKIQENE